MNSVIGRWAVLPMAVPLYKVGGVSFDVTLLLQNNLLPLVVVAVVRTEWLVVKPVPVAVVVVASDAAVDTVVVLVVCGSICPILNEVGDPMVPTDTVVVIGTAVDEVVVTVTGCKEDSLLSSSKVFISIEAIFSTEAVS